MKDKSDALPPLPKPFMRHWINAPFEDVELFTADQMRDYVRAALTAAPSAQAEPSDDWQHLKQYGYAPGGYMSKCHRCGATPIMDKLAVTCRPCAETMHNEAKGL